MGVLSYGVYDIKRHKLSIVIFLAIYQGETAVTTDQRTNGEMCAMQDLYGHIEEQEVVAQRICPKCQEKRVVRSRRRGPCEWLLRAVRLFPFRCDICGHRFMQLTWSGR